MDRNHIPAAASDEPLQTADAAETPDGSDAEAVGTPAERLPAEDTGAVGALKERLPAEDAEAVETLKEQLPDEDTLDSLEELFKIFGDSTRIKILYVLHREELCVNDIAAVLAMSVSAVSHQLRVLRQTRLIRSRRDGKNIYYSLADEHVHTIISMGLEHIEE